MLSPDLLAQDITLSGTVAPTSGSPFSVGYGDDLLTVLPGNQLCVVTGGTSPSLQGLLTYEQR